MQFNIAPQELQSMISRLSAYAGQISSISSSMRSYSHQLGGSWKDPQYAAYISQVEAISRQLKGSEETLQAMERQLKVLKGNLEHAHAEFRRL